MYKNTKGRNAIPPIILRAIVFISKYAKIVFNKYTNAIIIGKNLITCN